MIIDCVSDLHGHLPKMQGGDLLIVAGDLTARDQHVEYLHFFKWIANQNYRKKIVIAGNHDGLDEKDNILAIPSADYDYLRDSATEFEGLKIWGSPWTPEFCNWSFMLPRGIKLKEKWDLIPDDIDILITHGPPKGILDYNPVDNFKCGCEELYKAFPRFKNLKLHVFGHIHEGHGGIKTIEYPNTWFVNASIMDENYQPTNKPIRIIL